MRARALLKSSYHGHELIRVNLKGKGTVDIERKVGKLAALQNSDYWEIQYNKWYCDLLAFTLRIGKNGIVLDRGYKQ